MASYNTNLKDWGAQGSEYPDGYSYIEGEQPVDAWDNFITSNLIEDVKDHLIPLTNSRVESDSGAAGSEPSDPEQSHVYYDTDNERLEAWDSDEGSWYTHLRRDGDMMAGVLDMGGYKIHDSTGTLTLDGAVNASGTFSYGGNEVATRTWVDSNFDEFSGSHNDLTDVSSSDHHVRYSDSEAVDAVNDESSLTVSITGDADTVDGNHASDFASSGHNHDGTYHREDEVVEAYRLVLPVGTDQWA